MSNQIESRTTQLPLRDRLRFKLENCPRGEFYGQARVVEELLKEKGLRVFTGDEFEDIDQINYLKNFNTTARD